MPRKKFGKKTSSSLNDVNGIKHAENGNKENGIEADKSKTKKSHDTKSIDSKSSLGSTISLKKRLSLKKKNFIPFKRNKSPEENGVGGQNGGDVIRRTNSLNNISQDGGRSKIPILRPKKNQNEASSKHELCPTLNKNGSCESRSLVLNPGMDSWRMAGLMDTVSNSNLLLNSSTSLSEHKTSNQYMTNGHCDKSLETVTSNEILHQSSDNPSLIVTDTNTNNVETTSESNGDFVVTNNVISLNTELHTDVPSSGAPFGTHKGGSSNIAVALLVTESVNDEPLNLEESKIPIHNNEVVSCPLDNDNSDVVFTQESSNFKNHHQTYVAPDYVCVTPTVLEDIYDVDVYELDDESFCSVRKLEDFISEHHIELPKEVCCGDWLVLDIASC